MMSIEQIIPPEDARDLENLGFTFPGASCCWCKTGEEWMLGELGDSDSSHIPGYTFYDILRLLYEKFDHIEVVKFDYNGIPQYNIDIKGVKSLTTDESMMKTAVDILKWLVRMRMI